jgi:uncharacterized protein GlcG (DUF336 family)
LRLTNNFNLKFLVFAAAHHRRNEVGLVPPSASAMQTSRALLCDSQGGQIFPPTTSGRKTMIRLYTLAMAASFAALTGINAFAADPLPTETHKVLTADLAVEAAQAAIAACKAQGYGVSVVVAGRDGMPKVVIVRDGPRGVGPEVARRKAYTAAMQRVSTGDFTKRVSTPGAFNPGMFDKELSTGEGGVPIKVGDDTIGGIAAAGAPGGDKDEACAIAGLNKIKDRLN